MTEFTAYCTKRELFLLAQALKDYASRLQALGNEGTRAEVDAILEAVDREQGFYR